MTTGNSNAGSAGREDLFRYLDAGKSLESTQAQLEALEESEAVETFHNQMALLQRRLLADPQAFRDMFIADGTNAIVWEFKQPELGAENLHRRHLGRGVSGGERGGEKQGYQSTEEGGKQGHGGGALQ